MIQNLYTEQQRQELLQKQAMMFGMSVGNQTKVKEEDIKKMKKFYIGMYYAFTSINWGQGKTLGMAWQKALEQMDAYVASKMKSANSLLNIELLKYHKKFRRDMSKHIMTSKYATEKLPERLKKNFFNYGEKTLKENKVSLDNLHKQYVSKNVPEKEIQKQQMIVRLNIAQQKAQQLMAAITQNTYQRAA